MLDANECRDKCKKCKEKFKCLPIRITIFSLFAVFVLLVIGITFTS